MAENKLSKVLKDEGEKYEFGGEVFILKSLTGENIGLFEKANAKDVEFGFKIVYESLIKTYDDISYEDVKSLPLYHLENMVKLVMKASGLDKEE